MTWQDENGRPEWYTTPIPSRVWQVSVRQKLPKGTQIKTCPWPLQQVLATQLNSKTQFECEQVKKKKKSIKRKTPCHLTPYRSKKSDIYLLLLYPKYNLALKRAPRWGIQGEEIQLKQSTQSAIPRRWKKEPEPALSHTQGSCLTLKYSSS